MNVIEGTTEGATPIIEEVSVVCNNTKCSSYTTCNYCNDSISHTIHYVSETERYDRRRRCDSSDIGSMTKGVAGLLHKKGLFQGEVITIN